MKTLLNKNVIFILIIFYLIVIHITLVHSKGLEATIGFKSKYTSGISDSNIVYKPYGKIGYDIDFLEINITGTYTIHQQITDGLGNFAEINTSQILIQSLINIADVFEVGGGYSLTKGDRSYNSSMYKINGCLYIGDITLDMDYSNEHIEYYFTTDVESKSKTFIGSLDYDANDSLGYELEYHYLSNNFSNLDYTYTKNIIRTGLSLYRDTTIYMAGINVGKDSGDYMIYGSDLAVSKKIYQKLKIMILYALDYYNAPTVVTVSGGGHGGNNNAGHKGMNPYLRSNLIGKSFFSHSLSVSFSYSF
ncbi:MAG: hypothetical protein N3F66_05105 [Spirochaetes bacterium]|nr:hypothetical protein [Spirochaetota bacterium]